MVRVLADVTAAVSRQADPSALLVVRMVSRMNHLPYLGTLVVAAVPSAVGATYVVNPDGTGDFPTIQAAVGAAVDGDVIELGDGVFTGPDNIRVSFLGKGITVRSASGDPSTCIINGDGTNGAFTLESGEPEGSSVENLTIRNSAVGVHVLDSYGAVVGCRLTHNGTAVEPNLNAVMTVRDCVITGNYTGIHKNVGTLLLEGSTVVGNKRGVVVNSGATIVRSVLWGNCDFEVATNWDFIGSVSFTCSVVDSFNMEGPLINYIADNVFTNPLFCDPVDCTLAPTNAGEYTVDVLSPCLPENNVCGVLIGALGANCSGATPTIESSWGNVKRRYR